MYAVRVEKLNKTQNLQILRRYASHEKWLAEA